MRHIITRLVLFLILVLSALFPLHAATEPHNEDNLIKLRHRIQELQQNLTNKEIFKQEAADVLQKSESAISNIKRKLAQLAKEKKETNQKIKQLETRSKQVTLHIKKTQQKIGKLLYQQYLNGPQDNLKLLFNHQDSNHIARNLYYFQQLSNDRSKHIDKLQIQLEELEILTQIALKKQQEIFVIQAEQVKQKKQLKQENNQRNNLLLQITEQIKTQQQQVGKLKRDENRLSTLAKQINNLVTDKNIFTAKINNKLPDASNQGQPFTALKGQLNLPVRGELVNHFGSHRSGKNITWKGLFIRAPSGGNVKAIAAGQVVFSDWLRGFGNLMIIDHGSGYISLYGYNETIYQQVGEVVQGGDTIASVGNSGGNLDFGLYFELRHKSKPLDPLTWIKIE